MSGVAAEGPRCWTRVVGWALIISGAVLLVAGALGAREALYLADSLAFLASGGFGGMAAGALGSVLLISAALAEEWRTLHSLEGILRARTSAEMGGDGGSAVSDDEASVQSLPVWRWMRVQTDRVVAWVVIVVAAIWLLVGIRSVAEELFASAQLSYLVSGGVGGLFLLLVGSAALVAADLRDLDAKLDRIDHVIAAGPVARSRPHRPLHQRSDGNSRHGAEQPSIVSRGSFRPRVATVVGGAGVVALGWWRAADALTTEAAMDGLVIGVAGVGITAAGLGTEGLRHRRALVARMSQLTVSFSAGQAAETTVEPPALTEVWTAKGLYRYHRRSCPALLKAGSERWPVNPDQTRLEPCLLCEAGE